MVVLNRTAIAVIIVIIIIIAFLAFVVVVDGNNNVQCKNVPKPCNMSIQDLGDTGLAIRWNHVPGATSYNLYVADDRELRTNVKRLEDVSNPYIFHKTYPAGSTCYFAATAVFTAAQKDCESGVCDVVEARCGCALPEAPVLRCYDYFEFPGEGNFHVKTCGAPPPPADTRIFIQWFPVNGTVEYKVYCQEGMDVSPTNFTKKWTVPATSYYFETEPMNGNGCWSMIVTTCNDCGESTPSKIYTTCEVDSPP